MPFLTVSIVAIATLCFALASTQSLSSSLFFGNDTSLMATTSRGSSPSPINSLKCPPCLVYASAAGPGELLPDRKPAKTDAVSRVYWYSSTVGLTLDTVSIFVTQFNKTAVTNKKTIHGQLNTFNVSAEAGAQALASSIFTAFNPAYDNDPLLILANGTDGSLAPGISIPYPTPYIGLSRFYYVTQTSTTTCSSVAPESCVCPLAHMGPSFRLDAEGAVYLLVDLPLIYYQAFPFMDDLDNVANLEANDAPINNISFSKWVVSHVSLSNNGPPLASCFFYTEIFGPPAAKIPVSALTAIVAAPLAYGSQPPPNTPAPGNPVVPITSPKTPAPAPPKQQPAPASRPGADPDATPKPRPAPEPVHPPEQQHGANPPSPQASPQQADSPKPGSSSNPPDQYAPPSPPKPAPSSPEPTSQSPQPAPSSTPQPPPSNPEPALQPSKPADPAPPPLQKSQSGASEAGESGVRGAPAPSDTQPAPGPQQTSDDRPGNNDHLPPSFPYTSHAPDLGNGLPANLGVNGQASGSGSAGDGNSGDNGAPGQAGVYTDNNPAVLTVGVSRYSAHVSSNFIIASQTLKPGGTAVTVGGHEVSVVSKGDIAYIGESTQTLREATSQSQLVIDLHKSLYTADGSSGLFIDGHRLTPSDFVIASQTLKPGETAVTLGENEVFVVSEGDIAFIVGSTQNLGQATPQTEPVISFQGSFYTADESSGFFINGHRLTPGGVVTAASTPISLRPNGEEALIGTSTQHLLPTSTAHHPILTLNGATYSVDVSSGFIIDGQTVTPGAAITHHGTVISLPTGASEIVIGTSTQPFMPLLTSSAVITIGDSTYMLDSTSEFIIDGQTLTKGGTITVNGTPISYATNGADVVVATSTEAIDIGGLIMSGFGTGSPSSTEAINRETGVIQFTSSAPTDLSLKSSSVVCGIVVAIVLSLVF